MGEPQRAQCIRFTPGEDAKTVGVPFVKRNESVLTHTKVTTGDDVCRRQLSQWQCKTFTGAVSIFIVDVATEASARDVPVAGTLQQRSDPRNHRITLIGLERRREQTLLDIDEE